MTKYIKIIVIAYLTVFSVYADNRLEKEYIKTNDLVIQLKFPNHYRVKMDSLIQLSDKVCRHNGYDKLRTELLSILEMQAELDNVNIATIKHAIDAMELKENREQVTEKIKQLAALTTTASQGICRNEDTAFKQAEEVLSLKRQLLFMNPQIKANEILTVRYNLGKSANHAMANSMGLPPNNWSNLSSASRSHFNAELVCLSGLNQPAISEDVLYKPTIKGSAVTDLQLHWGGDKVMFTALNDQKKWQLHEFDLSSKSHKQLTNTPEKDLEFFDGSYLPDGRVLAISNIGYHGVPCVNGGAAVGNMVIYDPANGYLRRLTFDQDANWNPTILQNGKIMFTRWEYTDLTHYYSRIVMHMNPDGTEQKSLYGSGSMFPNSIFDMQQLPDGSSRFVGIISGHHGVPRSGRLIIFDPAKSRKEEKGMEQEIPFRNRKIIPIVKDEMVNGVWPQFVKPYPLTTKEFLVTAKLTPQSKWGIYLVDVYDNITLVAQSDNSGMIYSIPVEKKKTPPAIPDRIIEDEKEATVFIQDIYEGEGLRGVPRGEVKHLRIYAYEYAYQNTLSDHYAHGIQAGWDLKRLLGVVPVESDGSAMFKVPANTPISLQPLDADGRAIQWMRSWLTAMPGEIVSCVGCHEDQNTIPMPKRVMASTIKPHKITAPKGGVRSYTFDLEVQPVLDKRCVACHDGSNSVMPNFKDTSSVGVTDWSGTRYLRKSYLAFHPYVNRQGPEADMFVMTPYEYHASTSEVVRLLERGHHGVELTGDEWLQITTWIDLNAPGRGYFDANKVNGFPQYERRMELADKYNHSKVDWRKELADYAGYLEAQGDIKPVKPKAPKAKVYKEVKMKAWPIGRYELEQILAKEKVVRKEIEIADNVMMSFVKIPAGTFVLGSNDGYPNEAPERKVTIEESFWMLEDEVSNLQYNALIPEHDSRIYAQFWKDHVSPGYPANEPEQPVIRVSYKEAMKFCQLLSEKTGMKLSLPTESQWEWACRAGSDQPFWYGDLHANFGNYENLADVQLEKMVVQGVDPKPAEKDWSWFPYYNYLPQVASVDDGCMLPTANHAYKANPFGLVNMHGNVAEWTITSEGDKSVARGGSWIDRPKDATASVRKYYLPWQKVNNVGLRIILMD